MSPADLSALLLFATGCGRAPWRGFAALQPRFGIQEVPIDYRALAASLGIHEARVPAAALPLPTASTCFSLLRLPRYRSKEVMRAKLLYAIRAGAGFDMS